MRKVILFIFALGFGINQAFALSKDKKSLLVGNVLKNYLESYHYRPLSVNDELSGKAFKEFIKRVDFGKQFFYSSDIEKLEKYISQMDDQMVSGNHSLVIETRNILMTRVKEAETYRQTIFDKIFDFKKKEGLELDPEKKKYVGSEKGFKNHWRKIFKQSVLSRYLSLLEEKKNLEKENDEKKNQKNKAEAIKEKVLSKNKEAQKKIDQDLLKLSDEALRKKAKLSISKKYKNLFSRILKENHDDYLEKFFNSISNIFDPHTAYLPPKKKEDFDIDISGSLEGIGAVLQEDGSFIKVVKIVPGGAAWRQKELEVDDVILTVAQETGDAVDLVDMRVEDAVRYIRGPKNTPVKLTVRKVDGTRKLIRIVRDVVHIGASYAKSSVLKFKNGKTKIGYIQVPKFYRDFDGQGRNASGDVKRELQRLNKVGIDAVILDLRNNGGGALIDAKKMSGLFIKKGPIVQVRNRPGKIEVMSDNDPDVIYDGPLFVMINRFSASASEILAGAMQDYKRAIIIGGEHSHGKGTVQAIYSLNHGPFLSLFGEMMGALKLTIQKFYRITGASTQFKGVKPDIIIPDPFDYGKNREQDLDHSLPWDEIPAQKYNVWKQFTYNFGELKKKSKKRVLSDSRFKKIVESINYLKERKEDTKISLNLQETIKKEKENESLTKRLKIVVENGSIMVSSYEGSLKDADMIKKSDKEKWDQDFKRRKIEWVKRLRLDPGIEETMNIVEDHLKINSKVATMVK
jgi:carboxyl-terminal processing protease